MASDETIHGAVDAIARAFPDRRALVDGDLSVGYRELVENSRAVASALSDVDGDLIGVCLGKSARAVAALLGVLRAGRGYLPLDPALPDARLALMLRDSGVRRVIADADTAPRLRALGVEALDAATLRGPGSIRPDPTGIAYALYTSGTTGTPKAVVVEHRSVLALAADHRIGMAADDVVLQLAPWHVDPSVYELWGALLRGAAVVLPPRTDLSAHEIADLVVRRRITVLRLAAPLFRVVATTAVDALVGLRLLISGGDRADPAAVRRAVAALPTTSVVNGYGPTESTVYACVHLARESDLDSVPIGTPVDGTTAFIVDNDLAPVPDGDVGELCLAGAGLARGYLGRPGLTSRQFPVHPGWGRLYRTGDRVRALPDGSIEFVGRVDDQVKIRGYRVELGEVEHALAAHPSVRAAAVVVREAGVSRALAGFVVLGPGATVADLVEWLETVLPEHMIPTVTALDALPVTANGKVDRGALAATAPPPTGRAGTGRRARVRQIWAEALGGTAESLPAAGGDSLTALEIAARIGAEFGVHPPLADFFSGATPDSLADLVEAAGPAEPSRAVAVDRAPLSAAQEVIWLDEQIAPGGRYTISRTFLVRGGIDLSALRGAVDALGQRHPALRCVVERDADALWLRVLGETPPLVHVELSGLPEAAGLAREAAASGLGGLGRPLFRAVAAGLGDGMSVLHLDLHHLIADDWSLDVVFDELSQLYAGSAEPAPPDTSFPEILAAGVAPRRQAEARAGWAELLAGYPGSFELPADRARPAVLSGAGARVRVAVGAELSAELSRAAREREVSRFMLGAAAVHVVLSRYAAQDDLCFGMPVADRGRPGTERVVGCLVSMAALRVRADGDGSVAAFLDAVRAGCAGAYRFPDVPARSVADLPPFDVVVNHRRRERPPRLAGAEVEPWPVGADTAKFPLMVTFEEHDGALAVEIEYSTDLFGAATVERFGEHLVTALRALTGDPARPLREIDLLGPDERRALYRARPAPWSVAEPLHGLVSRRAAATPDKLAVVGDSEALTYSELEHHSDLVARWLVREAGAGAGDRVAICLDRSPRLAAAILGVLKAGAAYVPLDPGYPRERIDFTVRDAGAVALVSGKDIVERLFPNPGTPVLDVARVPESEPVDLPRVPAHEAAYLIYTSGSTGRPRGVLTEHRAVANTLFACLDRMPVGPEDVWLQTTSPGFDVAAFEQFMALVSGATLVYCADEHRGDGRGLTRFLREHAATVLVTVPSYLRALRGPDLAGVRVLLVAGEPADPGDCRRFARTLVVVNGYGPTEAAILATTHRVDPSDAGPRVPIGTALPGTAAYVVDRHGKLAAANVPGELLLAGAGVARGYWDRPEETASRFGADPAVPGERVYRTGDRVRMRPDGALDFLGRLDDQVKLRGFRIELAEVEAALADHPEVAEAAVALAGAGAEARLVACVVGRARSADLRAHLGRRLPRHMVPSVFASVERVPVTSHGKTDRTRVAELASAPAAVAAADDALAALWRDVLGPGASCDADADFFAEGGHSLLLMALVDRVEARFGVRVPMRDFLTDPTPAGLRRVIDSGPGADRHVSAPRLAPMVFPPVVPDPARPRAVLLTGATGFLGRFLLRELLDRTDATVHCLVRRPVPADPRVVAVPGDLGLGVDPAVLDALADEVDAIVHAGAHVHHLSPYRRLAPTNVGGTEALLGLLARGRPKRFHHVSTTAVFADPGRAVDERTDVAGERHSPGRGYSASKWAAERLVAEAAERGAAVGVYRLGRVGPPTDGSVAHTDDMFIRLALSSRAMGAFPVDSALRASLLPADTAAAALVALALAPPSRNVHHIRHPRATGLAEFLAGHDRRHGVRTPGIPLAEWLDRLAGAPDLPAWPYRDHLTALLGTRPVEPGHRDTLADLARLGVAVPDIDAAYIDRCWAALEGTTS